MGLPVHLCGRGGPPAGLPCGSQIPTYSSLGVRSLRDLDHHVTACSEGARACWGGGGGAGPAFGPAPFLLGGGGGSKRSIPLFPGPQGEPAHGLHPRFVVAEIWADRGRWRGRGHGGGVTPATCVSCLGWRGAHGSGPGFGAFGRSGARCRVRWLPSASGSFGDFWAGPGVVPRGGGLLVSGFRFQVDPPEAPAQLEGNPEKEGLPTAIGRLTRSRQVGSKRKARGSTPRHQGADTCRFQGGGGPRSVWVGRWGCTCAAAVFSWEGAGAAWGCAWAQQGTAQGCGAGPLHRGVAWDCAGVQRLRSVSVWGCGGAQQRGAAHGRSVRLAGKQHGAAHGAAAWAQRGAAQGRSSVGLRRGAAAWGCAEAQLHGAVLGRSSMGLRMGRSSVGLRRGAAPRGCAGAQQRWAAQGRSSMGRRRGAAASGCGGAHQHGAVQGRSSMGLRRGAAAWSCAGAQQRGAAQGRSMVLRMGLRRAAAWGCAAGKAQRRAAQERSMGPRMGAAWGCAGAQRVAVQGAQRGAAHGRGMGLRMRTAWE